MASASSSLSQNPSDPWDEPEAPTSFRPRAPAKTAPIPDDWEDDDDDELQNEEDNRRIWDDANAKPSNPMPAVVFSPSATSSRSVLSPPLGAFQPAMRILKRPSSSGSNIPAPPSSCSTAETIKAREARYQAARERIFGEEGGTSNPPSPLREKQERKSAATVHDTPVVSVVRNPRGPGDQANNNVARTSSDKGFRNQRVKSPLTSQEISSLIHAEDSVT